MFGLPTSSDLGSNCGFASRAYTKPRRVNLFACVSPAFHEVSTTGLVLGKRRFKGAVGELVWFINEHVLNGLRTALEDNSD